MPEEERSEEIIQNPHLLQLARLRFELNERKRYVHGGKVMVVDNVLWQAGSREATIAESTVQASRGKQRQEGEVGGSGG